MSKEKKYVVDSPELLAEWDYIRNEEIGLYPSEITTGSGKKAWWTCKKCNNSWFAVVSARVRGNGCPICSGKVIISGYNDLSTTCPEVLKYWDYSKNTEISPTQVGRGSHQMVWWKCEKGHSYQSRINNVVNGKHCPFCCSKKIIVGYNDLETWCRNNNAEYLIKEYSNENAQKMTELTQGTHRAVIWICEKGHSYSMKVSDRTVSHFGCPICSNHRLLTGFNDLKTWAEKNEPLLIEEYSSSNEISMDQIMPNSTKKIIWKCKLCGYVYKSTPNSRVNMRSGCPNCVKRMVTSFPEQACFFYISRFFDDAINGYKDAQHGISELDIYIPSIQVGIEYDGVHWHKGEKAHNKQIEKYQACHSQKIKLIRITEESRKKTGDCDVLIHSNYNLGISGLNDAIITLLNNLGINCNVNVADDELIIKKQYYQKIESYSLANCYPELIQEWNVERNVGLLPTMVFKSSSDNVWWICPNCGNEYQMRVNTRVGLPVGNCNKCRDHHYRVQFKRAVLQFTLNGKFISEYSSVTEASKATGAKSITICCQKRIAASGGFLWKYKDDSTEIADLVNNYRLKHDLSIASNAPKRVLQIDKNSGKVLNEYNSVGEAARALGKTESSGIAGCCKGRGKTAYGFIWKYTEDNDHMEE